jgi:hypothetical protein
MEHVTNLRALPKPATPVRKASRNATRALRRQTGAAIAIGGVSVTLTALSLSHLAHGIQLVTASTPWESWAMAVGIDLGFITAELAQVMATTDKIRKVIGRYARPAILGTLFGSACMNAFAFASQAHGWPMLASAVALGVAIPALIYATTRIGAALYIDCHNRG